MKKKHLIPIFIFLAIGIGLNVLSLLGLYTALPELNSCSSLPFLWGVMWGLIAFLISLRVYDFYDNG